MTATTSNQFAAYMAARLATMQAEQAEFQRSAAKALATLESIERSLHLIEEMKGDRQ